FWSSSVAFASPLCHPPLRPSRCHLVASLFNHSSSTDLQSLSYTTLFRSRPGHPGGLASPDGRHRVRSGNGCYRSASPGGQSARRSEEHTSELQSRFDPVCRLLLEKKKGTIATSI